MAPGDAPRAGDLWRDDIDAIVVPADACVGAAVLSLLDSRALVVAVEENRCALDVSAERLRVDGRVTVVRSYAEALGVLAAHKAGVNPACLFSEMPSIRELRVGGGEHQH